MPEQRIPVEEALQGCTVNAAYASFEEEIKGSLELGKVADLIIIDRDLMAIPAEQIREAKVILRVVGGKVVYEE